MHSNRFEKSPVTTLHPHPENAYLIPLAAPQISGCFELYFGEYSGETEALRYTAIVSGPLPYEVYDWHHEFEDQFIRLYAELDADRWELRKVEVFRDGRRRCANSRWAAGPTVLADVQFPPLGEILTDPQFTGQVITQAEFEQVWQDASACCPNCGAASGRYHTPGCDLELCSVCQQCLGGCIHFRGQGFPTQAQRIPCGDERERPLTL